MIKGALRLKEVEGAKILLSSLWVESSGLDKIRESFETGLKIHPEESY
jgi:hypothetical protein